MSNFVFIEKKDFKEKRKTINPYFDEVTNPKFLEMRKLLESYNIEIERGIRENKKIENENFKKHFFGSLENLMNQVVMIKNEKTKSQRIDDIFNWHVKRIQFFRDVNTIKERTSKNNYEIYPEIDNKNIKRNTYEAGEYPLFFESNNRTQIDGMLPPKDR